MQTRSFNQRKSAVQVSPHPINRRFLPELSHLLFYDRPLFLLQRYSPQLLLRAHFGPTERTRPIVCSRLKAFFGSSHVIGFPQKFESFFTSLCSSIDILLFCHSLSFEDPSEKKRFSLHLQHLRLLLRFSVPTFIWLDPPSPFSNHQPFPPSLPSPASYFLFLLLKVFGAVRSFSKD